MRKEALRGRQPQVGHGSEDRDLEANLVTTEVSRLPDAKLGKTGDAMLHDDPLSITLPKSFGLLSFPIHFQLLGSNGDREHAGCLLRSRAIGPNRAMKTVLPGKDVAIPLWILHATTAD